MIRRKVVLIAVLFGLMSLAVLWTYRQMAVQRAAAMTDSANLQACCNIAVRIEKFRNLPPVAMDQEKLSSETIGLIEQAAESAKVSANSLIRITPEPPRRVGDTVYKEKPTQVLLKDITLEQFVRLLHKLTCGRHGLHAKSIHLRAPTPRDTRDIWTTEFVVTYLIYDPSKLER